MTERLLPGCSSDWALEVKLHGEAVIPALVCKQLGKVSHPYHRLLENVFSPQQALVPGDWAEGGESSVTLVEQAKEQSCSHRAAGNA